MDETVGWAEVCERTGLTYRQVDYWTLRGYIRAVDGAPGSGYERRWPRREVVIAAIAAALTRAGIRAGEAVAAARAGTWDIDTGEFEAPLTGLLVVRGNSAVFTRSEVDQQPDA